jgi:hypothetical protein
MFRFAALRHPEHAALIARVLAIPPKRTDRAIVQFPSEDEIDALLASPDRSCWIGRRDHALLLVAIETGLRVSELTGLRCQDVMPGSGAHVRCFGKGRKERVTPLTATTVAVLRAWLRERQGEPSEPLFPASRGGPLSRDAVERLLAKHCATAARACPTLLGKKLAPHVLRHSCAVQLRRAGVDQATLALWLGHFSGVPDPSGSARRNGSAGPGRSFSAYRAPRANCEPPRSAPLPSLPIVLAHSYAPHARPAQRLRRTVRTPEKATRASAPPTSTTTPTFPSRSRPWHAPRHETSPRAVTSRPTLCSPSSKACDYADSIGPPEPSWLASLRRVGIIARSA